MRWFILSIFLVATVTVKAQHCPWDCSGMILLHSNVEKEQVYKLEPVLVDENKKIIVDSLYGTGKPTFDTCNFLYYDDFLAYRTKRIEWHYWYGYDTVYHFAAGNYVVKLNYCKYSDQKIYLRLREPYTSETRYRYIEIPNSSLLHLHEYNNMIRERETAAMKEAIKGAVIEMNCEKWMLRKEDCK